ncbi:MauE/DoxX family redox-associated membrane protein [Flavicella sediminum]|uniref:MauE/DoxX family redox-associated membrane protein n=1 Tax=Flavicella sediminum TaxID=2585141 RepID=UPI00111DCEC9|nr:MauE/DoxX family redox-associated membrane protein [Flavicella sediminum]
MRLRKLNTIQKIRWVESIAILGFLITALITPKLWLNTKDFPVIPLFENIPIPAAPYDCIIAISFFILLLLQLFRPRQFLGLFIILFYTYLCFIDQNRLQPYYYQSILTLLAVNLFPKKGNSRVVLHAIALLFFATYFWSGVQKLNEIFYEQWMGALLKHFSFVPFELLEMFTYLVPYLELLMGVFLLFNRTRKFSLIAIVGMHSIITIMLFYLGYGYNVVPWNLQNIASVLVLFWSLKTKSGWEIFTDQLEYRKFIIIIFTIFLPISNFFGGYDHLLSFSFFTSKLKYYYVIINDKDLEENLPEHIKKYLRPHNGQSILYPNEWAGEVNKVLFYPQDRAIHYLENYLHTFSDKEDKSKLTTLIVYNQ